MNLANYIEFGNDGKTLRGNVATLTLDVDLTGELFTSDNPQAPAYRLWGRSPRGKKIDVGGIWKKKNHQGGDYYSLTVNLGSLKLYANLGRYPGQDDESLYAVIFGDYLGKL